MYVIYPGVGANCFINNVDFLSAPDSGSGEDGGVARLLLEHAL